jgi:hypothetical protein
VATAFTVQIRPEVEAGDGATTAGFAASGAGGRREPLAAERGGAARSCVAVTTCHACRGDAAEAGARAQKD